MSELWRGVESLIIVAGLVLLVSMALGWRGRVAVALSWMMVPLLVAVAVRRVRRARRMMKGAWREGSRGR